MSLFCFLWIPLFYFFRRAVTGGAPAAGGMWALLLGSAAALVQFSLGPLVEPGGFGLSRWVSGCIDTVAVPALAPVLVCLLLTGLKIITGPADFTGFALLWLIPGAAVRAVALNPQNGPVFLVLVPLLWTAIAAGVPFFINLIVTGRRWVAVPASLGILAVPCAAAHSYWAFYSQKLLCGFIFLLAAAAPLTVSVILAYAKEAARA